MENDENTFDPYVELGVERTASPAEITSAYRRLARVHHPDRNLGNVEHATIVFQRLQKAYEMLSTSGQSASHGTDEPMDLKLWQLELLIFGLVQRREFERKAQEMSRAAAEGARKQQEEETAREETAKRQQVKEKAAKQAAADAVLAEKNQLQEEARRQEQHWVDANATTKEEKIAFCLHSDHCSKINLKKKFKCGFCSAKRGTM